MNEVYPGRALLRLLEQRARELTPLPRELQLAIRREEVVHRLSRLLRNRHVLVFYVHPVGT